MYTLRNILPFAASLLSALAAACSSAPQESFAPTDYVNPFIGASTSTTAAGVYHGLGKTFPGATTPYGMVQVSPNTITGGDNSPGYSYEHTTIEGFAFTQMSGVGWFGDLGNLLVMPTTGPLCKIAGREDGSIAGYRSHYDKQSEHAEAGYYRVLLTDYDILAECSATPHAGILRFTFPESDTSRIQIDLARRVGGTAERQYVRVEDDHTLSGWIHCTPVAGVQWIYCCMFKPDIIYCIKSCLMSTVRECRGAELRPRRISTAHAARRPSLRASCAKARPQRAVRSAASRRDRGARPPPRSVLPRMRRPQVRRRPHRFSKVRISSYHSGFVGNVSGSGSDRQPADRTAGSKDTK